MAKSSGFWNFMARRYARTPVADEAAYQQKLEITRRYLDPQSEVLEIGCGTGSTALLHAAHARHIRATDFSREMISIARQKSLEAGIDNVSFECLAVEELAGAGQEYDVVLGLNVIHLLQDWRRAIERIGRLIKPGGVFISSTACIDDFMGWFRIIALPGRWLGLLPHLAFFGRHELIGALESAGFTIEEQWQPGSNKALFLVARKS